MYFAMDEIGHAHAKKIKEIENETDRWAFLYETAGRYGFEGIHVSPSLYKALGLDVSHIPAYLQDFRLTYHLGGMYRMATRADCDKLAADLKESFEIAARNRMHDISIHPPFIQGMAEAKRAECSALFGDIISQWISIAKEGGITFSLETHVSGEFFLFSGLEAYIAFADKHPGLSILIDISHNFYDCYSEDMIIDLLGSGNVKGLHLSDALRGVDFQAGTHLPVGEGGIDFVKLLAFF